MKITINLATRPFTDLGPIFKRLRIAMGVFALVSIGLGIGLHFLHARAEAARARERAVDTQVTKIGQERQGFQAMMQKPDNHQVLDQAHNLNALFDQKAFSWTLAMEDLETVLPGGVQVTTLEPVRDEKTGEITLKLRVVGPRDKAVVKLAENLEHSRHFLRPAIIGESSENSGGPGQPMEPISESNKVNVDLTAEYNPATLNELPPPSKESEEKTEPAAPASAATPAPAAAVPAVGPGLRRPPLTGVAHPPAVQPQAPPRPAAQPSAAYATSPEARREAHQRHSPGAQQSQPGSNPPPSPRPRPAGPGGQQ